MHHRIVIGDICRDIAHGEEGRARERGSSTPERREKREERREKREEERGHNHMRSGLVLLLRAFVCSPPGKREDCPPTVRRHQKMGVSRDAFSQSTDMR
jgi:hypothetical protein